MTGSASTTRHHPTLRRFRAVVLAALFAATAFAVQATPVPVPAPLRDALATPQALANWCASNPNFTGRITETSSTTTAAGRITDGTVYGYISNVASTWSCTAFLRWSGVAWNTTTTLGTFDWGNLINSTSVACNFVVGSTDYIKANGTTDCPDTDAEYALAVSLAEGVYHNSTAHTAVGDFSYVHSDCGSYYGSESVRTGQSFSTSITGNRPDGGANCDPITIDSTGTTQTITYDKTAPTLAFTAPAGTTYRNTTAAYTVTLGVTEAVAGFGGTSLWRLQRQIAPVSSPNVCGTFANDAAAGNLTTGTTTGANNVSQTLAAGSCYRWVANATDQNGNVATQAVSASVFVDTVAPTTDFTAPGEGTTTVVNGTTTSVAWTETDAHSGVASHSLQRRVATWSGSACGAYANDGSPVTTGSPVAVTGLVDNRCYVWVQTLSDRAGNSSAATSGTVRISIGSPSANFTTPDEGTTSFTSATSSTVAWTESAGSGTITARSLQRTKGTVVTNGTCTGVTYANDGTASTAVSPVTSAGLAGGSCYRWVQTLTNSAPKTAATTSGMVLVDNVAPAGSLTAPVANTLFAGPVTITGTASDAVSFLSYQLEVGAGSAPTTWTSLLTSTTQVTAGTLGTWSPGTLGGAWTIRLTVRDKAGNVTTATRLVYVETALRGEETYLTRVPFDLGGGYLLDVGVANGEARLSRDLFSIPSYGPAQALSLTYSSAETGSAGRFGVGWSSNLTQSLTFESGFVVWHRADGGRVPFGSVAGTWTPLAGHHETLTRSTTPAEDTITLADQTRYVFENSGAGRLLRIENRFGKRLTLTWGTGSATAIDASGRTSTLAIDAANARITGVTDSAGRAWAFAFGYAGTGTASDLTSITDAASKVTTLGYASHKLTTVTRSRSRVTGSPQTLTWTIGYNATSGKADRVTDPIDAAATTPDRNKFTYGAGTTTVELLRTYGASPTYNTSVYALDALGRVTTLTDPLGDATDTTYDAGSNVTSLDRPDAGITTYTYDARGNVLTESVPITASSSVITVMSYSTANDLLTRSEADNDSAVKLVTKYTYDGSGHLTTVNVNCTTSGTTPPATASTCTGAGTADAATNLVTSYADTANDQLAFERDPMGRVTRHAYDTPGNETQVSRNCTSSGTATPSPFDSCTGGGTADHQTNVTTTTAYDQATTAGKAGLATRVTDPVGNQSDLTFDALGRQTGETLPGDASVPALTRTTTYDELGNVLTDTESWTPSGGGAVNRITSHVYDLANRETSVTDPAGGVSATTWDAAGNALSSDAGGVTTTRTFDGLGRVLTETTDAGTTTHAYDAPGNEILTGSAEGNVTARTFTFTGLTLTETADPDTLALTTTHTYDKLGRELTTTDPEGSTTTLTYDRSGRALTTATAAGTVTTVYDRAGNSVATKGLDGAVTATVYDPLDRVTGTIANCTNTGTTPPAAGATCAGTGTADATTNLVTTTYNDGAGTTLAVRDTKGITLRSIPNVRGLARTSIANCTDAGTTPTPDPRACTGAGTHDATANVVTTTTYDGTGATVGTTVAVGTGASATTETAYDAAGRAIAVKDPVGTITRNLYNAAGQLATTIVNCTDTTPPSAWAACAGTATPDGTVNVTTTYAYDAAGNQASVTAPNGRVTTSVYDADARLITRIENDVATPSGPAEDVTTSYFYDAAGRLAAVQAPTTDGSTVAVTRSVYDAAGRLVRQIANCVDTDDPANCGGADGQTPGTRTFEQNVVTDYAYDDAGNLTRLTPPDPSAAVGGTGSVTTRYAYDTANRLCRVLEASTISDAVWTTAGCTGAVSGTTSTNLSTRYAYDAAGNLATATDAGGHATAYAYDAAGHLLATTDPDGGVLVYAYDALGQKIRQENRSDPPMTASVTWTYDGAGRMASRTADSVTTTYAYDAAGNRTCAGTGSVCASAADRITATYDRLGRVLTVDDNGDGTPDTSYTYSLTSPQWTDPTGTYLVTLDAFDRPTALDEPVSTTASFTWAYCADGQVASRADPNGNTTAAGYDALGRPETKTTTGTGGVARAAYAWTRNAAGSVLAEASTITTDPTNNTRLFGYDAAGRLTGFTDGASTTAYGWTETLDRTSVQTTGGPSVPTTYDAANRPLTQNGVGNAYGSDPDGRLTTRPEPDGSASQRLEWDSLGRLIRVRPPNGNSTIALYTYDPLDRLHLVDHGGGDRVRVRYAGLTTATVQTIDDQSGAVIANTGTGWTGEPLEDWTGSNSNLRVYGTNGHHDLTWTASGTGSVAGTVRYDPWGTATSVTGSVPDVRFQSSWADEATKLSWVVTRWYAPDLGRFISEDSLLGEPRDPDSRHLYAYGAGEPVGAWDPDGRTYSKLIFRETIELPAWYGFALFAAGTVACWGIEIALAVPTGGFSLAFALVCGGATLGVPGASDKAIHTIRALPWVKTPRQYKIYERWSYWERTVSGNLNYKGTLLRTFVAKQTLVLAYSNWCSLTNKAKDFRLMHGCLGWW